MSSGSITFSSALNSGSRWWNWKTKPSRRARKAASSSSRSGSTRQPRISTMPAIRPVQCPEDVQQRALSGAGRPEDRHDRATLHLEVQPLQDFEPAPRASSYAFSMPRATRTGARLNAFVPSPGRASLM